MTSSKKVIDWDEAMEQCGEDEEFLRELLSDLRGETDTQVVKMEEALEKPESNSFHRIMRAAHVIKGASSNLMCEQLRSAAMNLEKSASAANEKITEVQKSIVSGGEKSSEKSADVTDDTTKEERAEMETKLTKDVQEKYDVLKSANDAYHAFLKTIDI